MAVINYLDQLPSVFPSKAEGEVRHGQTENECPPIVL